MDPTSQHNANVVSGIPVPADGWLDTVETQTGWDVRLYGEVESTMIQARRLAAQGLCDHCVAIAEVQTAGTGRHNRPWKSATTDNLQMTALFHPNLPVAHAPWYTLASAVAIAEALASMGFGVGIKWPNDVLATDQAFWRRKICGIRAEMNVTQDGELGWVSLGIGVNTNNLAFSDDLADIAVSLRQLAGGVVQSRAVVAGKILDNLSHLHTVMQDQGFGSVRQRWLALALGIDQPVTLKDIDGEQRGIMRGMDEDGHLLLQREGEESLYTVVAGDLVFAM